MLRRLFGRKAAPPSASAAPNGALAMVLLPTSAAVEPSRVLEVLRARWPEAPSIVDLEAEGAIATARIAGGRLSLAQMPVPVPAPELDGPALLAQWHWPGVRAAVDAHRSHLVVHATSDALDAVELHLLHTRIVAAAIEACAGLGAYVGAGRLLRSAPDYLADAERASRAALPILTWIGIHGVAMEDGRFAAYTLGLADFGLRELETAATARPPLEVLALLADLAHYQLATGRAFADGDTVGASASDRTAVRYGRSAIVTDLDVARIELA